jgi:hypothetical protein
MTGRPNVDGCTEHSCPYHGPLLRERAEHGYALVEFHTRPSWGDHGDLHVDGVDLGWTSREEAEEAARAHSTHLVVVPSDDYTVRNPRREA